MLQVQVQLSHKGGALGWMFRTVTEANHAALANSIRRHSAKKTAQGLCRHGACCMVVGGHLTDAQQGRQVPSSCEVILHVSSACLSS